MVGFCEDGNIRSPGFEDRRIPHTHSIFNLENRRTPYLRSSEPKIEEPFLIFVIRLRRPKNPLSSFFDSEHLRINLPISESGAEDEVEDRHRSQGALLNVKLRANKLHLSCEIVLDIFGMKKVFTNNKKHCSTGQHSRTKSGRGPSIKTCRIQNTDIPWTGRERAAHGGAAERNGGGAERDVDESVRPGDERLSCPPGNRRQVFRTYFSKVRTNKLYVNR